MPRAAGDQAQNPLSLWILVLAFCLLIATYGWPVAAAQGSPSRALSFSRRGLENAHRLSASSRKHGGLGSNIVEEERPSSIRDLVLSDTVLVSSVEGAIYGLDRNSGQTRWVLSPRIQSDVRNHSEVPPSAGVRSSQQQSAQSDGASSAGFSPLIGTSYGPDRRSFADLAGDLPLVAQTRSGANLHEEVTTGLAALEALQELGLYIVEPSAGQVYVLTKTFDAQGIAKTSLSKLPLTIPQLVELSPFSFPGDNSRVFVGEKSTSLVEIDIQSGKIGAVFGGGQDAGVWCDTPATQENNNSDCAHDGDTAKEWAYVGRTDYTLTIHLRGRPTLSQTLRYSTFAPNTADRDVSALWLQRGKSTDDRALMGMPEEGTVVCFDASAIPKRKRGRGNDNTLWISEIGATVAGIFDVVYPAPHLRGKSPRPMIVPHPTVSLEALFPSAPLSTIMPGGQKVQRSTLMPEDRTTLLGVADGHLYAMEGKQYPLVSFSPRARAGLAAVDDGFHHHDQQHLESGTCPSYGCLLGTYDLQNSDVDYVSGFEVGHVPLLGIGDGMGDDRRDSAASSQATPSETPDPRKGTIDDASSSSIWTWKPTPMMAMMQIVTVFLFAVLCGLLYLGAHELQRQKAEEAKALAREIVWTPAPNDVKSEQVLNQRETAQEDKETTAETTAPPPRDPDEVARELLKEEEISKAKAEKEQEKKKPVKRRRRGKRAGAAVQQREGKNQGSRAEDESGEEDEEDDKVQTRLPFANGMSRSTTEESLQQNGWVQPDVDAGEQAVRLAATVSMGAEGGSSIPTSNGPIVTRGNQSLIISEEILGYGSSGTVVFKGTFQGRAVAVKRLLRDFVDVAAKEVSLLESADNHANVIRYFYKEVTASFLFIALELCPASLADIVEKPGEYEELSAQLNPKRALFQIASGLQHLHSLSIVHRDIKPQNILVAPSPGGRLKMMLSDFGLSKRLDGLAQTSFSQTMNNPGGTVGWRAPEILRGDVRLDSGDGSSTTSSTNTTKDGNVPDGERKRLTRAVDIFALGCLTYYVLSNGEHPFGNRYERELNIIRKQIDLARLDGLGEEGHEAQHLVLSMIQHDAKERPSATKVMSHPYFWTPARRLAFLQDTSDRLDIMDRDPPAPALVAMETNAVTVVGNDWHRKIDKQFMEDIGKRRKYDGKSVIDLLRAIRNKKHHIHDLPPNLRRLLGQLPDGFLAYFTSRFPRLFLHTYEVIDSFAVLKSEATFAHYFVPLSDEV